MAECMNCPQHEEFKRKGWLLSGTSVYDAFNPLARKLYWNYANNEFLVMVLMPGGVTLQNH